MAKANDLIARALGLEQSRATLVVVLGASAGSVESPFRALSGANEVIALQMDGGQTGDARAWADGLMSACADWQPGLVLCVDSDFDRAVAAFLAHRLHGSVLTSCLEVRADPDGLIAVCDAYGGAAQALFRLAPGRPTVLCLSGFAAEDRTAGGHRTIAAGDPVTRTHIPIALTNGTVELVAEQYVAGPSLRGAKAVIAGGAGVGSADAFLRLRKLAQLMTAQVAASRPAILQGWASAGEKVGLTGARITPDLYMAFGISGASQHMAGCSRARMIVAVNRDPRAPIFRYANYGVVADAEGMIDALTAEIQGHEPAALKVDPT
jgi:electron transfer flavoprotein alpha subunit